MIKKNKRKKQKIRKSSIDKEQAFIKYGTTFFMVAVVIIAIVVSAINVYNRYKDGDKVDINSGITALVADFDINTIITNQISDAGKGELINKISASGLDILTNQELDYSKYTAENISISSDLLLTDQEVGLMYSYLFVNNSGLYNAILYQIELTTTDEGYSLITVASLDFYKLFTSKLNDNSLYTALPKRVYVTNVLNHLNNYETYDKVKYNNLSPDDSKNISDIIKQVNEVNLDKYVPNLIMTMLNNIALKSNSTLEIKDNSVIFRVNDNV